MSAAAKALPPLSRRKLLFGLCASVAFSGCARHRAFSSTSGGALAAAPAEDASGTGSLKVHAAAHHLLYGCAVDVALLASDPEYAALIQEQAAIVVAESAMNWDTLRPGIDSYNFDPADALVAFAESNHCKVRGHALVWHRELPAWFKHQANTSNGRTLLTSHIERVAGRYSGRMHSWDVVNEAIQVSDGRPDSLRNSPWLELIGPDYLELAFSTARLVDPQALLTYNESGLEGDDPASQKKRAAVLMLLRRMKARHVPIDALGIQSHLVAGESFGAGLRTFLAEVRELGLQIFVTELDVNDRDLPGDSALRDAAVARTYTSYLDVVLAEPATRAVLTWGITDRHTSLNTEEPRADRLPQRSLPFGRRYLPKDAFFALRNSIDHRADSRGAALSHSS